MGQVGHADGGLLHLWVRIRVQNLEVRTPRLAAV